MKTLTLTTDQKIKILKACEQASPHEACGLLLGEGDGQVTAVIASDNLSITPERNFEIDPALIIKYQKRTRCDGTRIMGHYHSHPEGKAVPSARDQQQNYDASLVWCIVAVKKGRAVDVKAYTANVSGEELLPLKITIL